MWHGFDFAGGRRGPHRAIIYGARDVTVEIGQSVRCGIEATNGNLQALARAISQCIIMCCIAFFSSVPALAQGKSASLVLDANTGQELHAQAADEPRYPASLTKMMTLYMAFDLIEQGRLSYATKIKMSQEAASAAPSKLDLEPGEQISVADAMKALVTKSANDVAVAIAEHIAGSETRFAEMMTERARRIGLRNTTFRNASGLPHPGQVTTARDMITLGLRLHDDFPRHYALFATRNFVFDGDNYRSHNNLLFNYPGTEGIKTGYTRASGFNVVVSVKRDGRHLMAAVFGGGTASARDAHVRALLSRNWSKASRQRTRKAAPMLVARAQPAPAPKPAARPLRPASVAAATSRPEPSAPPGPAASPPPRTRAAEPEPGATAGPVTPAGIPVPVKVAQVRRVMVAPRIRQSPPTETTEEPRQGPTQTARIEIEPSESVASHPAAISADPASAGSGADRALMQPGSDILRADLNAHSIRRNNGPGRAPHHAAPLDVAETAVVKSRLSGVRPPSTLGEQAQAMAAAENAPHGAAQPLAQTPGAGLREGAFPASARTETSAGSIKSRAVMGAQPSTLAAQAANIESGRPAVAPPPTRLAQAPTAKPAYRLRGPETALPPLPQPQPAAIAGFHIQVGAYATVAEAERQLASVRQRAGAIIGNAAPLAMPVQKSNRQLYRARFAGFDAPSAASVCLELRRLHVDCFVMRAE